MVTKIILSLIAIVALMTSCVELKTYSVTYETIYFNGSDTTTIIVKSSIVPEVSSYEGTNYIHFHGAIADINYINTTAQLKILNVTEIKEN